MTNSRRLTNSVTSRAMPATQRILLARRRVVGLDAGQGSLPVVAQPHLPRGLLHFHFAEDELALADSNQLVGRVRQPLAPDVGRQGLGPQRLADQRVIVLALDSGKVFADVLGILVELLGGIVAGFLQPPGEARLISLVKGVPALKHLLQCPHTVRSAEGRRRGRLAARLGQMFAGELDGGHQLRDLSRRGLDVRGPPVPTGRFQFVDRGAKGHQRRDLAQPLFRPSGFVEGGPDLAPQQQEVGLLAGIERGKVELVQPLQPPLVQLTLPIEIGFRRGQLARVTQARLIGAIFALEFEHRGRGGKGVTRRSALGECGGEQENQKQRGDAAKPAVHGGVPRIFFRRSSQF